MPLSHAQDAPDKPDGPDSIDTLRAASRELVRQLGFMGRGFAGTDLPPSAVHALIEIESGRATARDLAKRLHLDKSSTSRMLRKLIQSGDLVERPVEDGRVKALALTAAGRQRVLAIHAFARAQVTGALDRLTPDQKHRIIDGVSLYSQALAAQQLPAPCKPEVEILCGYQTGLIGRTTQLHAAYYAATAGFGQRFEAGVAAGLAEFCSRLERPRNAIWTALSGPDIAGSVAIDGEDLGQNLAHLRWFIVDDRIRGIGVGRRLLSAALDFVDRAGFSETHLWTFSGLTAARHLYESHGFRLEEERLGTQWASEMLEQRFVRRRA